MSIRDANVIVIEASRTEIRAGLGLHDLLKQPSIEIKARVGLRQDVSSSSSPPAVHDYLVGTQLDDALTAAASPTDIAVSYPFASGDIINFTQAEALFKYILFAQLYRRRVQNESPVILSFPAGLSRDTYQRISQIFFERFNVAGFAILERPIAQLYAANTLSGIVVDVGWDYTDITPIYDGFVLHHARETVKLGIRECQKYLANLLRANQGVMDVVRQLVGEPAADPKVQYQKEQETLLALAQHLWENGHIKVPSDGETAAPEDEGVTDIAAVVVAGKERAVIESGMKKKATAKASAAEQARAREIEAMDLVEVVFREKTVTVGKERHRFCEPLFDLGLLGDEGAGVGEQNGVNEKNTERNGMPVLPLQEAVGHAVGLADVDQRLDIWKGLLVTGDITRYVKGIGPALQSRLAPFLAAPLLELNHYSLDNLQPRTIRLVSVPEYYAEYRETGNGLAAFLGGSVVAKIIFNDSGGRNYVSKAEYAAKGPQAIIEMTPGLL